MEENIERENILFSGVCIYCHGTIHLWVRVKSIRAAESDASRRSPWGMSIHSFQWIDSFKGILVWIQCLSVSVLSVHTKWTLSLGVFCGREWIVNSFKNCKEVLGADSSVWGFCSSRIWQMWTVGELNHLLSLGNLILNPCSIFQCNLNWCHFFQIANWLQ